MPTVDKFSLKQLRESPDGRYSEACSKGLYAEVHNGKIVFYFMRVVDKKRSFISLQTADLLKARAQAKRLAAMDKMEFAEYVADRERQKQIKRNGLDEQTGLPSFGQCLDAYLAVASERIWSEASVKRNLYRVGAHLDGLRDMRIDAVTVETVASVVETLGAETRKKVESIIHGAFVHGSIKFGVPLESPLDPKNRRLLYARCPVRKSLTRHHGALLPEQIPEFFIDLLAQRPAPAAYVFAFSILTATRSATVRAAKWADIHISGRDPFWLVPASDLKVSENGSLKIPLSRQAVAILREVKKLNSEFGSKYVFLNANGKTFSTAVFDQLLDTIRSQTGHRWLDTAQSEALDTEVRATQHGLARASFQSWSCSDHPSINNVGKFDAVAIQQCLHHKVTDRGVDKYGTAYNRNTYYNIRKTIMQAWADFCFSKVQK